MCGRYYIDSDWDIEELKAVVDAINRRGDAPKSTKLQGEIFPTDVAPVLAGTRVVPMRWGFQFGSTSRNVINARAETAKDKPMFRDLMRDSRCLVPASAYYEWERGDSNKVRHTLGLDNRVLYMAGLYRWDDAHSMQSFVILTKPAQDNLRFIHDRMPVIFDGDTRREWLSGRLSEDAFWESAQNDICLMKG